MRKVIVFSIVCSLVLPAGSWAMGRGKGRPEPMPCPQDVDAAIAAACPCDGTVMPDSTIEPWRNHGQYVRCVVKYRNRLWKSDCIDKAERRQTRRCAARSTCGKADRVRCCVSQTGTCSDTGTCSNDDERSCASDTDCTKTKVRMTRGDAQCIERGGTVDGTGSICTACVEPTP
jgi:hypothetical protein